MSELHVDLWAPGDPPVLHGAHCPLCDEPITGMRPNPERFEDINPQMLGEPFLVPSVVVTPCGHPLSSYSLHTEVHGPVDRRSRSPLA